MNAKAGAIRKKALSWLLVLMMVIAMIPAAASTADAAEADTLFTVKYLDETKSVTEGMWNQWIADDNYKIEESYSLMNNKGTVTSREYTGVSVLDIYTLLFSNFDSADMSEYVINAGGAEISGDELFAARYAYTVADDGSIPEDSTGTKVEPIITDTDNGTLVIGMKDKTTANQSLCRNGIFSASPSIEIKTAAASGEGGGGGSSEVTADKSWYDADKSSFTLSDEADLMGFADLVNEGAAFEGKTVTLANDISLTGEWTSIGDASHAFKGTFDGKGYTVSGLKITDAAGGYKGLFGNNEGTVKNFNLEGSIGAQSAYITSGADNIGGAAGYNNGTVKGVNAAVSVYVKTGNIYAVGGVAGQNGAEGVIEQCVNTAYIEGTKCAGGIAGRSYGIIRECVNTGEIKGNGGGKDGIGGICGLAGNKSDTCANLKITDCYNTGVISNNNGRWHGGIAGFADDNIYLQNCYDIGEIKAGYSWNWNPIIGHTDTADSGKGAIDTICNNYSLEGLNYGDKTASSQPNTVGIIKTESEFKTEDMAGLLGSSWTMDSYNINDGYPVLKWQKAKSDEKAAAEVNDVINSIPALEDIKGTADDIYAIKAAEDAYNNLSDDAKKLVDTDPIKAAKEKVAALNHTSNGVTIKGLDWDKIVVAELKTDGIDYDDMKAQAQTKTFLAMYDIKVYELVDNEWAPYEISDPGEVTITNDKFTGYVNAAAIHQMERAEADGYDYETVSAVITGNKAVFTAEDFSNYGIVAEKATVNNTAAADNTTNTGDDFNMIPVLVIMLLAMAGIAAVFYRKKHTD